MASQKGCVYQRRFVVKDSPPINWTMARPETIRAAIAATRHELMMSTDKSEEQRIEARLAQLEHALRLAR